MNETFIAQCVRTYTPQLDLKLSHSEPKQLNLDENNNFVFTLK